MLQRLAAPAAAGPQVTRAAGLPLEWLWHTHALLVLKREALGLGLQRSASSQRAGRRHEGRRRRAPDGSFPG